MDDKFSDDKRTHDLMEALKQVLDNHAKSHGITYDFAEGPGVKARCLTINVRVSV